MQIGPPGCAGLCFPYSANCTRCKASRAGRDWIACLSSYGAGDVLEVALC